jgi:hypothetical protein
LGSYHTAMCDSFPCWIDTVAHLSSRYRYP